MLGNAQASSACRALRELSWEHTAFIGHSMVTNSDVGQACTGISGLPQLATFIMPQVSFTQQQWAILAALPKLQHVDLWAPQFTIT